MINPAHVAQAIGWRRHLHAHPELAFEEVETGRFVAERLTEFGLGVTSNFAGTGVVGTLSRGTSRRTIGIRADMDALPIGEETGLRYASRSVGKMHACGHDGHTAMLLLAARACAALPDLDGTVHFIFQPAEENEGGARRMVLEGLFRTFPVDEVFALHNWPALDVGSLVARDDAMMAAFGTFEIEVTGRGSHGAMPHEGADPVVAACHIVTALQTITSRNISPLEASVVSVTQVHTGDAWNVIPERAVIRGTTRWFAEAVGQALERRIRKLSVTVAEGLDCTALVDYVSRYPATINHPASATFVRRISNDEAIGLLVSEASPSMAAEDFAFMLREVPGCYVWLGSRRQGQNPGLHSTKYDFNDDVLGLGARLWTEIVRAKIGCA